MPDGMLLEGRGVTKHFRGLAALERVDFDVRQGEILGLIGPNGAGKTTLLSCISATEALTGGEIRFRGRSLAGLRPSHIARLGIARTFQIMKPFPGMTVWENLLLGGLFGRSGRRHDLDGASAAAREAMDAVGLAAKRDAPAGTLTIAERKKLELARALAMQPVLLLLDEIMAGLTPREVEEAMATVRRINAAGVTVLLIEHVMRAIMGISHRVVVLHHGQKVAEGSPEEIARNERVIEAYLGERFARRGPGTTC